MTQLLGWPGQLNAFSSSSIAPFFFFSFFTSASTAFSAHFSSSSPCFHPNSLFTAGLVKENKLVTFMVTPLGHSGYRRPSRRDSSSTAAAQQILISSQKQSAQVIVVLLLLQSSRPRTAMLTFPLDRCSLLIVLKPSGWEPAGEQRKRKRDFTSSVSHQQLETFHPTRSARPKTNRTTTKQNKTTKPLQSHASDRGNSLTRTFK